MTLTNLALNYILPSRSGLFSPYRSKMNFDLILTLGDHDQFCFNICFAFPSRVQAYIYYVWARSEQNEIWPDLDLIWWPWPISFLITLPSSQISFHQIWAWSEQSKICSDLELRWPWPISFLKFVSYSSHKVSFHKVWAWSEQKEIWPDLDLGWHRPISFLMFVSYSHHIQVAFHQVWTR